MLGNTISETTTAAIPDNETMVTAEVECREILKRRGVETHCPLGAQTGRQGESG